jgi:peptidoglycan/xylan/chitin deacetylase (PgdA/CDA1 family)
VDRYYIEGFLREHAADVRGVVLEVQEPDYTRAFGADRVARSDVVDVVAANSLATVVADLRHADEIPDGTYDCLIVCQTLHVIDDVGAAVRECHRILRPGGVLLATFPCASRGCLEYGDDGDLWRFTEAGARYLVEACFGPDGVETRSYGNVLATTAFLYGLACDELDPAALDAPDPYHPTVVGVRARKAVPCRRAAPRPAGRALVLGYHRVASRSGPDVHRLCTPPAVFAAHLAMLRSRFDVLPLDELLARAGEETLPRDAVALTLDDGYRDALEGAVPLLAAASVPATLFVSTEDGGGPYWWDMLAALLLESDALPASLRLTLAGEVLELATHDAQARRSAHDRLHVQLVHAPLAVRSHVLDQVAREARWMPTLPSRLRADEVEALARRPGLTVGSHGVHHLALAHVEEDAAWRELVESRRRLERILGAPPASIAYAYGDVDRRVADLAAAAGYAWGLTCNPGTAERGLDPLRMPRLVTAGESPEGLEERIQLVLGRA